MHKQGHGPCSAVSSSVALIPADQSLALVNSSDHNYVSGLHLPYVITRATGVSTTEFWGDGGNVNIQSTLLVLSNMYKYQEILFSQVEGKHPSTVCLFWASTVCQVCALSGSEVLRLRTPTAHGRHLTAVPLSHRFSLSPKGFFSPSHPCRVNRFPMGA